MDEEITKRITIDDLPKAEEELSADEEKGVTGGVGVILGVGDGSVRSTTVGGAIHPAKGNTIGGALGGDVSNPVKP